MHTFLRALRRAIRKIATDPREPARKAGAIVGAVAAALTAVACAVTYLADVIPPAQRAKALGVVVALGTTATALTRLQANLTRWQVWPDDSHYESVEEAAKYAAARASSAHGDPQEDA